MTTRVVLYLSLIGLEALLSWAAYARSRANGWTPTDVIGGRWASIRSVLVDVSIGLAVWALFKYGVEAWLVVPHDAPNATVQSMLPHGVLESSLWILVSLAAGFGEEFAFRGYVQRRMQIWGAAPAIAGQAVLFGALHFYEGLYPVIRITIYGVMLGIVARWRRSLRPGMIAHAWTDVAAGLLRV